MSSMKQLKSVLIVVIVLGSLAWALTAIAQGPPGPLSGEITDVTDATVTIYTSEGESVVVNLTAETKVYDLLTQTEGSLADLKKLTAVEVMGRPSDDGSVDAWMIVITPWGDHVRGEITLVDSQQGTITVEDRVPMRRPDDNGPPEDSAQEGSAQVSTVAIGDAAQVLVNGEESQVSDLTVGQFVTAYGETQADGSLVATVVVASDGPQGFGLGPEPGEPGLGGPGEHPGPGRPPEGGRQRPGGMEQ